MKWLALSAVLTVTLAQPAQAESKEEMAFGFGQFVGAATFCKIPKDKVQTVAAGLLGSVEIDIGGPGPEMTRFTAGVADGVRSMQAPDAAPCDDVKTAFDAAYEKFQ